MDLCFDVFKIESDGRLLWLGATASFAGAKAIASVVHAGEPERDFLVLDQRTGGRQTIRCTELIEKLRNGCTGA
jgi:hypothetical protein